MKRGLRDHLDMVTEDSFIKWKSELYTTFASATGVNGRVELGVFGDGTYAISYNKGIEVVKYKDIATVIKYYKLRLTSFESK